MTKETVIISGFPGVGKSFLFKRQSDDVTVLDSDSSKFSWIEGGVRHPDFPNNYIEHIKSNVGKADYIFVSSHDVVRDALKENNINYTLVYPRVELKEEYLKRYEERGSDSSFLKLMDDNWEKFIGQLNEETFPNVIRLGTGEYLEDIF